MKNEKSMSRLRRHNEKRQLNKLSPITIEEYSEMERFNKAYQLELMKGRKRKKTVKLMLIIAMIVMVVSVLSGAFDWIVELIKEISK